MKKVTVTRYEAFDGELFESEWGCREYERRKTSENERDSGDTEVRSAVKMSDDEFTAFLASLAESFDWDKARNIESPAYRHFVSQFDMLRNMGRGKRMYTWKDVRDMEECDQEKLCQVATRFVKPMVNWHDGVSKVREVRASLGEIPLITIWYDTVDYGLGIVVKPFNAAVMYDPDEDVVFQMYVNSETREDGR